MKKNEKKSILFFLYTLIDLSEFEVPGEYFLFYSLLSNLIKNAIESSPQNEKIHIRLSNNNHIRIAIHNQGAIHESIRENFFEKYVTFGKKYGTGLGTYSSKLITETMGGEISMISSEESGTTIAITFINVV